ncbi:TIGR01244 family phosphatase [Novosphingobium sp. Gsoil 351]|nr:TIGR01244 family sulfur transferase [Novosphingobium sp. Gsoil 351]QGN55091.1 TIGR01244 family phosphatase [Novosphingobium sp. Gsoil 351]
MSEKFRHLNEWVLVSPQIDLEDVASARDLGVALIVNNRPEGESGDQTPGAEIAQAASQAGLDYVEIPVTHAGFSEAQVTAMRAALDRAGESRVLAYCRSGTRSTLLWALAEASAGADPQALCATAAGAGYDLAPIAPLLDMLAAKAG